MDSRPIITLFLLLLLVGAAAAESMPVLPAQYLGNGRHRRCRRTCRHRHHRQNKLERTRAFHPHRARHLRGGGNLGKPARRAGYGVRSRRIRYTNGHVLGRQQTRQTRRCLYAPSDASAIDLTFTTGSGAERRRPRSDRATAPSPPAACRQLRQAGHSR